MEAITMSQASYERSLASKLDSLIEQLLGEQRCCLPEVAKQMGMSDRSVQRKVKALLGTTFSQYVLRKQLSLARRFLSQGQQVKAAAYNSGFKDPSHLNRTFKKQFGITPGEYSKKTCLAMAS